jgi:hypothetical protein
MNEKRETSMHPFFILLELFILLARHQAFLFRTDSGPDHER